jgi:hypothetical protein
MRIYMSSLTIAILLHLYILFPNRKVNVLRSFAQMSPYEHRFYDGSIPNINSQMFDSGVFTKVNAKSGNYGHITLQNYIKYMKQHKHHYKYYSNYDEDFTSQGFYTNLNNLKRMRGAGLDPFPVVHDFFMREIQYYLSNDYDFIALGGVRVPGKNGQQRTEQHIKHAMSLIPHDKVKTHLFGASSYKLISKYPFFSCDSSSWAQNNRYGFILYWDETLIGKEDKTLKLFFFDKNKDYFRTDRKYWETYPGREQRESYIKSLGFTYIDLMGPQRNHYRQLLNAIYYLTIEDVITLKWSKIKKEAV